MDKIKIKWFYNKSSHQVLAKIDNLENSRLSLIMIDEFIEGEKKFIPGEDMLISLSLPNSNFCFDDKDYWAGSDFYPIQIQEIDRDWFSFYVHEFLLNRDRRIKEMDETRGDETYNTLLRIFPVSLIPNKKRIIRGDIEIDDSVSEWIKILEDKNNITILTKDSEDFYEDWMKQKENYTEKYYNKVWN